jgi:hypothetical protein
MTDLAIETRVAHAGYDESRLCGYRLFEELVGRESIAGLFGLVTGGRRLTPAQAAVLDDVAVINSVADPRIPLFKVTRLACSFGGGLEGLAAGMLCLDCTHIGGWYVIPAVAGHLVELRKQVGDAIDDTDSIDAAVRERLLPLEVVPGFGVIFRERDERIEVLERAIVERHQRHHLPYWRIQKRVSAVLGAERGLTPNETLSLAAVWLDLGFCPEEIGPLATALSFAPFLANVAEGWRQAPPALQRLPSERLHYVGPAPRVTPRARR